MLLMKCVLHSCEVILGGFLFLMFTSYDNAIVLMLYRVEVEGRSTATSSVANQPELCPSPMTLTTPVSQSGLYVTVVVIMFQFYISTYT